MKEKRENGHNSKDINTYGTVTISRNSYYDLTHLITEDMPVYPGDPQPEFKPIATIEKQKVNVTRMVLGSHTGTHVDAQNHFIANGNSIDIEQLDKFIGEAITLDLRNVQIGAGITDVDLEIHSNLIMKKDIVLLYTGTSEKWAIDESIKNKFTYLEPSGAKWIVEHGIKCVGIDTLSVEKYGFQEGIAHKKLLSSGIGIIENLNSNLRKTIGMRTFLVCMPLPLKGLDGTPTRAVAFSIV